MPGIVSMFFFKGMYGFVSPEGEPDKSMFFHASDFHRLNPGEPLPIVGETVDIVPESPLSVKPRAIEVRRQLLPEKTLGVVVSYNPDKGWGFVEYDRNMKAFLHASEVRGWIPYPGARVSFYLGNKNGKPRACWVQFGEPHVR